MFYTIWWYSFIYSISFISYFAKQCFYFIILWCMHICYIHFIYYMHINSIIILCIKDLTFSTKISAHNLIYLHIFLCTYKNFHVETDNFWVIFGNFKLIHLIGLNCFIRLIKFANSYWLESFYTFLYMQIFRQRRTLKLIFRKF